MRSRAADESRPGTKHPLFEWLDNAARIAAAQNARKQERRAGDAMRSKPRAAAENAEVVIARKERGIAIRKWGAIGHHFD
jgi:hypothetical protein